MAQVRPALTVDVGLAQQPGGSAPAGRAATQAARAAIHAARSAQAPGSQRGDELLEAQPGDGADGFSSDDDGDGVDAYASAQRRLKNGAASVGARATRDQSHGAAQTTRRRVSAEERPSRCTSADSAVLRQYAGEESDSSQEGEHEREDYGPEDAEMEGNSDEDGVYDEEDDEDDMSSSPSIPDENIDFDLVYALHNFVATVEGQATVHKGNSLTLLDDSNSYW